MKLTWFGKTTLRIHVGGRVLVGDLEAAPPEIERAELISGADRLFHLADDLPEADPIRWQPRRPGAPIEEELEPPEVLLHRLAHGAVLVDAAGEPPLVLLSEAIGAAGRWSRDAIVVAFAPDVAKRALEDLAPRMIALAMPEAAVDAAFAALRDRLGGTALVALEPGLAVEA